MGYKPTLGGLKKAQAFLKLKGHPMPIFKMNIYDDDRPLSPRLALGSERILSIDETIRLYGGDAMHEVMNVRLTDETGTLFVQFTDKTRSCLAADLVAVALDDDWDVRLECRRGHPADRNCSEFDEFEDFLFSKDLVLSPDGRAFANFARWGKSTVSWLDRLEFSLFPQSYGREIFHEYRAR